jgi:hypothetical protein
MKYAQPDAVLFKTAERSALDGKYNGIMIDVNSNSALITNTAHSIQRGITD